MLDFDGEGRLRPLVYEGATAEDRKRFEARLYLRYKYNLSHYLRFYRDMSKKLDCPSNCRSTSPATVGPASRCKHGVSVSCDQRGDWGTLPKDHANYLDELDNSTVDARTRWWRELLKLRLRIGEKGGEKLKSAKK